jgi:hypothetical protein
MASNKEKMKADIQALKSCTIAYLRRESIEVKPNNLIFCLV